MDAKVTIRFKKSVAEKAKQYARKNNISLSRLVEYLLEKATAENVSSFEEFPIAKWVQRISEGTPIHQTRRRTSKDLKEEFYMAKK